MSHSIRLDRNEAQSLKNVDTLIQSNFETIIQVANHNFDHANGGAQRFPDGSYAKRPLLTSAQDYIAPAAKVRFPPLVLFAATRRIPQLLETASEVAAF